MIGRRLRCSAASCRGSRAENQDNLRFGDIQVCIDQSRDYGASGSFDTRKSHVFCVCDGVGGAAKGDMASTAALKAVEEYLAEGQYDEPETCVLQGAQRAHEGVVQLYEKLGMVGGSTLAMAAICGDRYAVLNIGDSPVFLFRRKDGTLRELSRRHTLAWDKRSNGEEPEPKDESVLVHYLGKKDAHAKTMAQICTGTLCRGDALLLCSDGVSGAFTEKQLRRMMKWRVSARSMANRAKAHPNSDNCTAVCVHMG